MFPTRKAAVALLAMTLSTSACEFFLTKPFAPLGNDASFVEIPDVLAKYAPGLPPTLYARANPLGPSMYMTGSLAGDAMAGLQLSAAPLGPLAVDLSAVTPAEWVNELGTGLQYIDDETTPQALPFAFSFYGQSYSSVYVSANGHISFGSPITFKRTWNIPDGAFVLAAPAYADWMPASRFSFPNLQNSRVFVNTVGADGDRRFVVTWNDMRPCCSLSYPGSSFQVQLLERTGEVRFVYREMQMVISNASAGIAAGATHMKTAAGTGVLGLQGCTVTYQPSGPGYREVNSCAPEPVNLPPVVQVGGPYTAIEGDSVELSGTATDENGDSLTYVWTIGDGTSTPGHAVSHRFVDNGAYFATLSVSDGELVTLVTTRVDVANAVPALGAFDGATLFIGEPYRISVPLSDPGVLDAPWHYSIDWGDGSLNEGDATTLAEPIRGRHVYSEDGTYTVRVTVRDKDDGVATAVEAQVVVKVDEIDIDVKPSDPGNRIYLRGHWDGFIPVAVLTSDKLDATTVDVSTLTLGRVGSTVVGGGEGKYLAVTRDVDKDGDIDLVVMFDRRKMIETGDLTPQTTALTLRGWASGGKKVVGTDAVQVAR